MGNEKHIWNGRPIVFEERTLFDGRISIRLPRNFKELPPEKVKEIYPLTSIPDLVFGDVEMDMYAGFRYTEHELTDESVGEFLKIVRMMLEQTGSRMEILSQKGEKVGGHTVSSLNLISRVSADSVYHKLFFCALDGRILMGFINFSSLRGYHSIMEEIFRSFCFTEEG